MSVETSTASEARLGSPYYLNYQGHTVDTCLSCGHVIGANQDWLKYYRALYLTPDGARLSDVFFASLDWREMQRDCGHLGSSERAALLEKFGPWYQMSCLNPSKAHIFHESCWIILSRQLEDHLDLDKFFEVCKDVAPSGRKADYESLSVQRDAEHTYPLKRPIIRGLLAKNRLKLPQRQTGAGQGYLCSETDCFRLLPLEIRTLVSSNLSTSEFFSLRQVSRSMAEVFGDQFFWRTRFLPRGERGFLSSLLTDKRPKYRASKQRDWRLIYRCSVNLDVCDGHLFELRRRWHNNRWLGERYMMTKSSDEEIRSHSSLIGEMRWQRLSLKVRCDRLPGQGRRRNKCSRCMMEHAPSVQAFPLNKSVLSLAVYVLREAYHTYITGIGLLERDFGEPSLILGYRIPDQYSLINIDGKQLMGFNIIAGDHAIYAIQAVFKAGSSRWVGNQDGCTRCQWITGINTGFNTHRDVPRLVRLTTEKGVQALSGKLDYCKLIGFSVA